MALPRGLRFFLVGLLFIAASFLLYAGLAMLLLTPGGYNESALEKAMPLSLILVALLMAWGIARMLRQPASPPGEEEDYRVSRFPLVMAGVVLGAVLFSVLIWRHHW
jgi:hypothetical protein